MGSPELSAIAAMVGRAIRNQQHPERVEAIVASIASGNAVVAMQLDSTGELVQILVDGGHIATIDKAAARAVFGA